MCAYAFARQITVLQEKYRVLTARITTLEERLLAQEVELAELTAQVETQRKEAINDVSYKLEMLSQSPPARSGREDRQRLTTISKRPLTQTERAIIATKGTWVNWIVVACNRQMSAMQNIMLRQLRQHAWHEWQSEKHALDYELRHLTRDAEEERETNRQRSLRQELLYLQRERTRLIQQTELMAIEIHVLEQFLEV
jgi:uncharacterized coiled-coil protein SlyX